jgi:hypothetical protein
MVASSTGLATLNESPEQALKKLAKRPGIAWCQICVKIRILSDAR